MEQHNEKLLYKKAKKQAKEIRSFYINLTCYCIVIPGLVFINLYYTPEYLWFYWSMLGWGMGLFFHAMQAFGWNPFFSKEWENRKLRQFLDEEDQQKQNKPKQQ